MYSFEPTEEQKMLIDSVNRYAVNDLQAKAHDADEEGLLPEKLVQKGWDLGILQASVPESYGGFGERPDALGERIALERDMLLHFPENEWHVFEYEEGGHLTIAFFYPNPGVYSGQIKS